MGGPLIECVPNFSEGRDKDIIDAIINSITSIDGVSVLDVDMGADFNRTVVTMVGEPEAVLKAAIKSTGVALKLIDMSKKISDNFADNEYDTLVSAGEQISCSLLAGQLIENGVQARSLMAWQIPIITEGQHKYSRIKYIYKKLILKFLMQKIRQ